MTSRKLKLIQGVAVLSSLLLNLLPTPVFAATTTTFTSQADFAGAIAQTGSDTAGTPGSLKLSTLTPAASPATETRDVALIVEDDLTVDTDIEFYLESYFSGTFTYSGDEAVDDVLEFAEVTALSDLNGYEIVITDSQTTSEAAHIPQDILDSFADAGGTVVQNLLDYSYQRQRDTYTINQTFTYTTAAVRDMAYDGTNIWTLDDTSPERVLKINPADGSTIATYCAPNTTPRGVEYVGGTLYITDSTSDSVYGIAPAALTTYDGVCASPNTGTVYPLSTLSPAPGSPWGITHDGTYFYVVDSVNDRLYQFTFSGTTAVQNNAWSLTLTPRAVDIPRGLASDGTYVYFADQGTNLIYKLSTSDASVVDAFDPYDGFGAADTDIVGLAFISGDLWVTDDEPGIKQLYNNSSYFRDLDSFEYFSKGNTSFESPSADPKGLAYDGTYFWTVDDYNNRLYKLNATTGAVVSSCQTPYSRPTGLAYYGGSLYLADTIADTIYVINPATCATSSSYASPGTLPQGLVHDGTNLWHVDTTSDLVYKLNATTGATVSSFASPAASPRGLAYDGTYLWLADEATDLYYQINQATGATIKTRTVAELSAEGIAFKDSQLWSVDDIQDRIYNVDSTLLAQGQMATPSTSPQGFAYDGTVLWHVDSGTDKLYKLNASTGATITSFDTPGLDPRDVTWDGTYLWITTDADNRIYKINPADGSTVTFYAAPASDPTGIVYVGGILYVSDPITNKVYQVDATDGSVDANFAAPGSASGTMAYDGTSVWLHDTDEKVIYQLSFDDDIDEGITEQAINVYSTQVQGIEFISGTLWMADSYFDMFFDADVITSEPDAIISVANAYTVPYAVSDQFYFTTRSSTEGYYIQRRLASVPETASREILATSSRGGAVFIHETRTSGHMFAIDMGLLGTNFEISRQTIPAVTLFFNALGIQIHADGIQENTVPTYASLSTNLTTLLTDCPTAFTRATIGTSSNSQPIYSYTFGTSGKPIAVYVSGTHGNEEHAYIPTVRYMQELCTDYLANDDETLNMFANYQTIFVPLLNPYGIANATRYNANGVDLNRNWDYQWSSFTSSTKGASAFSEPETTALRDLILANVDDIIFVNDAHSAMEISPGMTWGCDLGVTAPDLVADIYDIYTTENARRWFEERASVGRWLNYDRYTYHSCDTPFFGNWLSAQGLVSSTNEVMGKKDIGSQRMVHTSAWYMSHFHATKDALSYKYGRSVFRIDSANTATVFSANATATTTTPAGTAVTFQYGSNSTTSAPTTWYTTAASAPANRYLFVETVLSRAAYADTSPSIQDFSITYGVPSTSGGIVIVPKYTNSVDSLAAFQNGEPLTGSVNPGDALSFTWETIGTVPYVQTFFTDSSGVHILDNALKNTNTSTWTVPSDATGPLTFSVMSLGDETPTQTGSVTLSLSESGNGTPPEWPSTEDSFPDAPGITPGDLMRGKILPAVYYVSADGMRHPFSNEQTYFTWYPSFDSVEVVDDSYLSLFPLGSPMPPKPGTVLIKIESVPRVYAVEENPADRYRPLITWITSEDEAKRLYGPAWSEYIIDIPPTSFSHFVSSSDAPNESTIDSSLLLKRTELHER